jgi:hypothetical protein
MPSDCCWALFFVVPCGSPTNDAGDISCLYLERPQGNEPVDIVVEDTDVRYALLVFNHHDGPENATFI